jgi:hypothetical protein
MDDQGISGHPKELGNPFIIFHIGLFSGHILDVPGIFQDDLDALFKDVKDRVSSTHRYLPWRCRCSPRTPADSYRLTVLLSW